MSQHSDTPSTIHQAAILAGGKGSRLANVSGDIPKPLVPIGGKPVLEHQIELLKRHGIREIVIFSGYLGEKIALHLGDGSRYGLRILHVLEETPLGSAGCIVSRLDLLDERFLLLYGDTMLNVHLPAMIGFHAKRAPAATVFLHPNDHPADSDLVEIDELGYVTSFHPYPHPEGAQLPNLVNAALYVFEKQSLETFSSGVKLDFGKHVFPRMLTDGARIAGYVSREYIKDMGTPSRYDKVCEHYASGRIARGSLQTAVPAVFLDRDGTLIRDAGHLNHPDQVELLPGAAEAVRQINRSGFLAVLVTNQPVIARGELSEAGLKLIHNKLETLLGAEGAYLDAIYHCPHHPDSGFPGERSELKIRCDCRKPEPGLIIRAAREMNIDLTNSWLIGDSFRDVGAAINAHIHSVLLAQQISSSELRGFEPTAAAGSLAEAVRIIPDIQCDNSIKAVTLPA